MVEPRKVAPHGIQPFDQPSGSVVDPDVSSSCGLLVLALGRPAHRGGRVAAQRLSRTVRPGHATESSCSSIDGDIYTRSIQRRAPRGRCSTDAAAFDFSPSSRRDGTTMVFLRSRRTDQNPAILTLMVANADGTEASAGDPTDREPRLVRLVAGWHADRVRGSDRRLVRGRRASDGRHQRQDSPTPAQGRISRRGCHRIGDEIVYRSARPKRPAGLRDPGRRDGRTSPSVEDPGQQRDSTTSRSPCRRTVPTVTFTRWSSTAAPRVLSLDVATGLEIAFPNAAGDRPAGHRGADSPDGALRGVRTGLSARERSQIVVANADGPAMSGRSVRGDQVHPTGREIPATWAFTPDGSVIDRSIWHRR